MSYKKNAIFVLFLVLLAVVSGCTTKSKGNSNSPKSNGIISSSSDENELKIYNNIDLGFSFKVSKNCEVTEENEFDGFDEGRRKSFRSVNKEKLIASMDFTSKDYMEGVGEGGCTYYSDDPIDLSASDEVLLGELKCFNPKELKRIKLDYRDAIRFFTTMGYENEYINEMIIMPYNRNEFTNMVIKGPILKEIEKGGEYDISDINTGSEENILFENIIKTLKFAVDN